MEFENMSRRVKALIVSVMLTLLIAVAAFALLTPRTQTASKNRETVEENCTIVQTLNYTRCEHSVTRRLTADKEYKGCTLEQIQQAYAEWAITSFSPAEIVMSVSLPLYCPDHLVVLPDGAGVLGVYENVYGDGYALKNQLDIPLSDLDEETRESVHLGVGFDNAQALESWLESFES